MSLPEPAHALVGTVVDGRYRIVRLIGHGGMGAVYEAEAIRLRRPCACKVLLPEFTRDEGAIARFEREAMAAARVDHPNVVEIHDTGRIPGGAGYIAMELLRGESLDRTLRRERRLPWPRARHIAVQICRALAAAHAQGIVHRDLKPENCFRITQDGDQDFIKLVDFGIARLSDPDSDDHGRLTATNSIVGTYSYMAHELVAGRDCDHRVDVWAAGVVLYEMLTGVLPFRGKNRGQILTAILTETPATLSAVAPEAEIPAAVEQIVARALEKDPARRFAGIDELAQALLAVEGGVVSRNPVTRPIAPMLEGDVDATASTVTGSREGVSDPYEITELAGESMFSAPEARRSLGRASVPRIPTPVPERRQPRRWITASGLVVAAMIAAFVMQVWTPVQPSVAAAQPSAPSLQSLSHPAETAPEPVAPAVGVARVEEVASVEEVAPASEKPRKSTPAIKPRIGHAEKIKRELARLSRSAGVRACLAAHRPESLRAELEVDATGRVTRLSAQPLMRGSALEKCVARESQGWRLPTGDANYKGTQEFKLP